MKEKKYENPELIILLLTNDDIITESGIPEDGNGDEYNL